MSVIEDEIYGIMNDYEYGSNTLYIEGVVDAILDFLSNYTKLNWRVNCSERLDCQGGVCTVAWVEDDYLGLVIFDYIKE